MKTHIAQEVNKAQLEEVTQLTVNRILESALATATTMTCCSARRTNRPQRESEEYVTLSLDLLQNASVLASSYPRRKRCLQSPVTVLQLLLTSNLVKKHQRVIVVAIANAIAEHQVIVVAIANPIAHSKVKIRVIFVLKIPYPRTQKARGDNLLSRILLPESISRMQNLHTKLYTLAQALHKNSEIL